MNSHPSPSLALFMIVKNESSIIKRCLNSLKDYIDYVVITDTGSTDNTVDCINEFIKENNVKGMVYKDEWNNFGQNRTNSMLNAKKWLDDNNIDKSNTYLMTIDADMLIEFKNFDKTQLNKSVAWSLCQYNSSVKYYNLRIFRSDLPYICVGVTHEYWTCKDVKDEQLHTITINDRGDGGCKSDKFERDIRLLLEGLDKEPNNHRYYFYLAQSYADIGDKDNAIKWYNKRVQSGGWYEEIFISYKRIGELYMDKKEPEKAIYNWMLAYETIPERSETLYKICNYYRNNGNNKSSLLFAKQGLSIPYPNDLLLFLEYPIYDYKFIEEISIIGYYTNKKMQGFMACEYLLLENNIPQSLRESTVNNHYFYIQPLSKFVKYKRHNDISISSKKTFKSSSGSLLVDMNDGYKGIVRAVNYSITDNFEYRIRGNNVNTINYWAEYDSDDNIKMLYEINMDFKNKKQRESHINGLEDIRICYHNGNIYGLCVDWEYGAHNHPSVSLIEFRNENHKYRMTNIYPIKYNDHICQKNWTLFSDNSKLYALYSHHPLTILEINPENGEHSVILEKYSNHNLKDVRGSANPLKVGDYWFVLTHEVIHKDTRKYCHRFLKYSSNWDLLSISYPFYFQELFVEFSLSIMYNNNDLMIVYSNRDNTTEIIYINPELIPWLPKDIKNHLIKVL
jgi:tetratricopeptide (TPR) repeat protein